MATFAMIHGAGDVGWYWHLVERELRSRGHESVAPDLPCEDDSAGLPERPDEWMASTGFDRVMRGQTHQDVFYHDVPRDVAEQARSKSRNQSDAPGHSPWPLSAWPDVPTKFILCTEDRFFPPDFMHRVVAERLGITPDEIASGHCAALSHPKELADMLAGYAAASGGSRTLRALGKLHGNPEASHLLRPTAGHRDLSRP